LEKLLSIKKKVILLSLKKLNPVSKKKLIKLTFEKHTINFGYKRN